MIVVAKVAEQITSDGVVELGRLFYDLVESGETRELLKDAMFETDNAFSTKNALEIRILAGGCLVEVAENYGGTNGHIAAYAIVCPAILGARKDIFVPSIVKLANSLLDEESGDLRKHAPSPGATISKIDDELTKIEAAEAANQNFQQGGPPVRDALKKLRVGLAAVSKSVTRLADEERRDRVEIQDAVRLAAARIYNHLARQVTTNFVWVVEDDVIPPDNAAELLLQRFDQNTGSVAGPYQSRFHDGYVAWTDGHQILKERGESVQTIEGNGFGCVMLRSSVLKNALFTCRQLPYDFDPAFYERLKQTGFQAKLNWDVECEHLES